jgi:hypothetical protein
LVIGALAVGLVAASAGAAFSQEQPAAVRAAAGPDAAAAAGTGALSVPPELAPPAGNVLSSVFSAHGVQIYTCTAAAWKFTEPAATLTGTTIRPFRPVSSVHFRGPSWQSVDDGSLIVGALVTSSPVTDSIPQLLLKAASTRGPGVFGSVTFVQRLATTGGAAPAGTCTEGDSTAVPYRAVYRFFVAG